MNDVQTAIDQVNKDIQAAVDEVNNAIKAVQQTVNSIISKVQDAIEKAKDTIDKISDTIDRIKDLAGDFAAGFPNGLHIPIPSFLNRDIGKDYSAFHCQLNVGGRKFGIVQCSYAFNQSVDSMGKPVSRPRGGRIVFVLPSRSDEDLFFYRWMFNKTEMESGTFRFVVWSQQNRQSYKTVSFRNAYCVGLKDFFNNNDSRLMHITVTLMAEVITIGSNDIAEFNNEWE